MKKVVRKKKGVTLIAVLMVTAIISTVVTAMLGMISTSYRARTQESKRLQNMYTSDSALDVVYNIINRTSRAAILKAINQEEVKNEKDEKKQNTLFKQKFISYIVNGVDEANLKESNIKQSILNWTFPIYGEDGIVSYERLPDKKVELEVKDTIELGKEITGDEEIKIRVHSTFKTEDSNFENSRVLEANYIVTAPEYKEISIEKSVDINLNPVYRNKVITTDKDLNATGNITFNGDIWAKGSRTDLTKDTKYSGGIIFNNANITATSNIYTSNTLTVNNNSNVRFKGDIYSSNTYISEDVNKPSVSETKLEVFEDSENTSTGKLVTFNDLVLNATNSTVALKTYFGINDITGNSISTNSKMNLAENKSSSIIVNNLESSLKITGDSYIRGVAYIDTPLEEYQTGESVSVKGNYVAYTDPQGNKDITMKYYNPLQLIEYLNGNKIDLAGKENHFINYYQGKEVGTAKGITLGSNVYSAGAVVSGNSGQGKATGSNNVNLTDKQIEENVNVEKSNFATNVLAMGDSVGIGYKTGISLYEKWLNSGLLDTSCGRTVADQISFDAIDSNQEVNDFFGKLILNNDATKKIKITAGQITVGDKVVELDKDDMRAVIVTNGEVEFDSGKSEKDIINFTGNIITTNDVTIKGKGEITLNYDEDVTTRIYASNKEYLDNIFNKFSEDKINVSLLDSLSGTISDYNENEYLRKGQWQIIE